METGGEWRPSEDIEKPCAPPHTSPHAPLPPPAGPEFYPFIINLGSRKSAAFQANQPEQGLVGTSAPPRLVGNPGDNLHLYLALAEEAGLAERSLRWGI